MGHVGRHGPDTGDWCETLMESTREVGGNGESSSAGESPGMCAGAGVLLAHVQQVRPAHGDDQAMDGGIAVGQMVMSHSEGEERQHGQAMVCDICVRWIVTAWPTLL